MNFEGWNRTRHSWKPPGPKVPPEVPPEVPTNVPLVSTGPPGLGLVSVEKEPKQRLTKTKETNTTKTFRRGDPAPVA